MLHLFAAVAATLLAAGSEPPWVDAEPGIRVGAPVTIETAGRGPSIAPLGEGFVAAWLRGDPDNQRRACAVGLRLTKEGRPSGAARVLHCAQDMTPPTVVAGSDRVAVAWGTGGGIEARILSPDLSSLTELYQQLPRPPERVSASHDGSAFVIAWSTYDEAAALSFSPDGTVLHDGPVKVARRSSQSDVTRADVACVSSGVCAVLFRQFYGNSQASSGAIRLEGGRLKGGFGGHSGPFEHKVIAGAGRLVAFYSTYARTWGESLLAGNARVFDYQASQHRIRDISGAIGPEGTLVAWRMEPRERGKAGTSIAYIHPDPGAARPYPLAIPEAISPAVATLDGRRFVLLTASFGIGAVHARLVEVDPSKFGKSPEQRGPIIEGVVLGPDGRPAAAARVSYYLFLRDGSLSNGFAATGPEGRFSIRHPRRDDRRAAAEATRLICWAEDEANASPVLQRESASDSSPVTLQLRPHQPAARVRLTALAASGEGRYGEDLQVLLAPGVRGEVGLRQLRKGRALELDGVAPGPAALILIDPQGFQVAHQLQLQPGAEHAIEVPFAMNLPPGKVGLVLDDSLAVLAAPPGAPAQQAGVRKGDVVLDVGGQRPENLKRAIELLGGSPGTPVTVTVRRGGTTSSFQIIRSAHRDAPPPRVTVTGRPATKASLFQPAPGERVLAEAAALDRETGGPFRVDMDEAIPLPGTLRADVGLEGQIHEDHPTSLTITIEGPGDLRETREVSYFNWRTVHVGCDPVEGGGEDQCRNNTWEEPASPPPIEIGPDLLNTLGKHRLKIVAPGAGEVQRTFLVVPYELGPAYRMHQHHQVGTYRLRARAAVRLPSAAESRPLTVYRALFRSGGRTLTIDVSESGRSREELEAMLSSGRWAQAPWVNVRDQRAIKIHRRPDGFEAVWNADVLVRVAGAELGEAEQVVLDHYLGFFPSRQPASK